MLKNSLRTHNSNLFNFFLFLKKIDVNNQFFAFNAPLKRNNLFIQGFNFFFKLIFFFLKRFKFSEPNVFYNAFFNKLFLKKFHLLSKKKLFIIFLSGKNDLWFSGIFTMLANKFSGYHFSWDSSNFFFFFKKKRESTHEFFPIFFISPNLFFDSLFLSNLYLFSNYPHFLFLDITILDQFNLNYHRFSNVFPLFIQKKNMLNHIFFWFKLIRKNLENYG